jgi:hypothetical protein
VACLALAADALALTGALTSPPPAGGEPGSSALLDQEIAEEMAALTNAARQGYGRHYTDFVGTLEDLAQAMSRLSGRKQVILLSAGANESAWQGLASDGVTSPASLLEHTARDAMARLFGARATTRSPRSRRTRAGASCWRAAATTCSPSSPPTPAPSAIGRAR